MLMNLLAGTLLVGVTVCMHAGGLMILSSLLKATVDKFEFHRHRVGTITIMAATVLGLFVIHTAEIWVWALAFRAVGAVQSFSAALTFSTLSFSTLGAEGISLAPRWTLFGSIEGVNGFLLIGWSTAYLIPAWTRHGPLYGHERD